MSSPSPPVSVVMPIYNAQRFGPAAIESILHQTFTDFEFIIVDDCSTDQTPDLLQAYQQADSRIRVIRLGHNQGATAALNRGCQEMVGHYIARMDADDISLPDRLEKQVAFLDAHPEVGVVGCWIQNMDASGQIDRVVRLPAQNGLIKWLMLFFSPFAHPTVMMRREVLFQAGLYQTDILKAQDYDLWVRLSRLTDMANIPAVHYHYRHWDQSISSQFQPEQQQFTQQIIRRHLEELLQRSISAEQVTALRGLSANQYPTDAELIRSTARLIGDLQQIYPAVFQLTPADVRAIRQDAAARLWLLAGLGIRHGIRLPLSLMAQAIALAPSAIFLLIRKVAAKLLRR
jgi:hypothetical protein